MIVESDQKRLLEGSDKQHILLFNLEDFIYYWYGELF